MPYVTEMVLVSCSSNYLTISRPLCHARPDKVCMTYYGVTLIAKFMGPTWGSSGADRTQVGPMLATWTLLSGKARFRYYDVKCQSTWMYPEQKFSKTIVSQPVMITSKRALLNRVSTMKKSSVTRCNLPHCRGLNSPWLSFASCNIAL